MNRMFGMMPSSEIKIEKNYKTDLGTVIVQAGNKGYSVIFADGSSEYDDIEDTAENNFNRAYKIVKELIKS